MKLFLNICLIFCLISLIFVILYLLGIVSEVAQTGPNRKIYLQRSQKHHYQVASAAFLLCQTWLNMVHRARFAKMVIFRHISVSDEESCGPSCYSKRKGIPPGTHTQKISGIRAHIKKNEIDTFHEKLTFGGFGAKIMVSKTKSPFSSPKWSQSFFHIKRMSLGNIFKK